MCICKLTENLCTRIKNNVSNELEVKVCRHRLSVGLALSKFRSALKMECARRE